MIFSFIYEILSFSTRVVLPFLCVVGGGLALQHMLMDMECASYEEVTGVECEVRVFTAYVKHEGQWMSYKEKLMVITAKDLNDE